MTTRIRICQADYSNPSHGRALVVVLDAYAQDPMGGSAGLSEFARTHLLASLAARPQAFSVLAFDGETDDVPVGLANCFEGFSTFACKPLVNLHDLAVIPAYRGQGVGARLLESVEAIARARGACKLTLEVLSGNGTALGVYARSGFAQYQLDPAAGQALFLQKWLDD